MRRSPAPAESIAASCLLSCALAFAAGGCAPCPAACALTLLALFCGAAFRRGRPLARGIVPIGLALGFLAARADRLLDPLPALLARWDAHGFREGATPIAIEGRLLDLERLPDDRLALTLRLERSSLPPSAPPEPSRARIGVRLVVPHAEDAPLPWAEGDRLRLTARIGRPRSFRNPSAFDYAIYLEARGIRLTGSVKSALLVERIERGGRWRRALPALRRAAVGRIAAACGPERAATGAFLAALLAGERESLPADLEDVLQRAGVFHIIALSGFNVALLLGACSALLLPLMLGGSARRVLLLLGVLAYWGAVRPSGSIARASLMALLVLAGGILGRRVTVLGSLGVASLLLLLFRPAWLQDAGFQLSFAATFGLLAGTRTSPRTPAPGAGLARTGLRSIAQSARASWTAFLACAPFSACHFHALTAAALPANLVAVPIAAVSLFLAAAIALLPPAAHGMAAALASFALRLLRLLSTSASFFAGLPGAFWYVVPPSAWLLAAAGLCLGGALLGRRAALRRSAAFAVASLTVTALLAGRIDRGTGRLEITLLDVGQGDAVLVRFPNGLTLLTDCGGLLRGGFDLGARVVAPALRGLGLLRLDILAITHAHRDHIGGALAIVRAFRPRALWLGRMPEGDPLVAQLVKQAEQGGAAVLSPRRGAALALGGARLEVLHPDSAPGPSPGARNHDSLVLRLAFGSRAALLTGDAEADVEAALLGSGRPLAADFLKVGHHGSATSSGESFLDAVDPAVAFVSVGASNPWGHPAPVVLERLRRRGALILETDRDGAIGAWTDGTSPWRAAPLR